MLKDGQLKIGQTVRHSNGTIATIQEAHPYERNGVTVFNYTVLTQHGIVDLWPWYKFSPVEHK